jgi:dTDP-glucose 4,6-dehydratase
MKKILVTGGLGFIGSHFIDLALKNKYKIYNYDKINYASNLDYLPNNKNYNFTKIDIVDIKDIPNCDYIVHFAAESSVDLSIYDSCPFVNSNILATYNLLEILKTRKQKKLNIPTIIYIGTDEVFGDILKGSNSEMTYMNPSNPYAATKACAEMLIGAWSRTFKIPFRITRTTNNYGNRQHYEKLIPNCIINSLKNNKICIHGTGEYIRNWIHVEDNCNAILKVMEKGRDGQIYHISSSEEYSVLEIVKIILGNFDRTINENTVSFVKNREGQDIRYSLNNEKIKKELDWEQTKTLKNEISNIINFYKHKHNGK